MPKMQAFAVHKVFSKLNSVTSMNEVYPLEKAQDAYDRMMSGNARFRVVLKMNA
jgi:alcohol dehydrogenase